VRRTALAAGLALLAGVAPGWGRRAAADGAEPPPHPVFFEEPDEETAREIAALITNSFKDQNKFADALRLFVRRYGLVAVPALVRVIEADKNEPEVWASMLTIAALRREHGPAPQLWRALPPLVKHLRETPEPWRRAFAALALGTFYGPNGIGWDPDPPSAHGDGPRARARRTLQEGMDALAEHLRDEHPHVRVACALALAKIGGLDAWQRVAAVARDRTVDPNPQAGLGRLLALALLPGSTEGRLEAVLTSEDELQRAMGAFGIGLRAVMAQERQLLPDPPEQIVALDKRLQNTHIRASLRDGREAAWARGSLALLGATPGTWRELYDLAIAPSTDPDTAIAAAQAFLFCPGDHPVRAKEMPGFLTRPNAGTSVGNKERVLGAFLGMAGADGTEDGVEACRSFLRDPARTPRGTLAYDVRYHAAVGLLRALASGGVLTGEVRAHAVEALSEGVSKGLQKGGPDSFQRVLGSVIEPAREALLKDPTSVLSAAEVARVEATYRDRDALLARVPYDTALHRLDLAFRLVMGLDAVTKAIERDPQGARIVNKDFMPLRYLLGWLGDGPEDPGHLGYFERRDLHADRGLPPAPPPSGPADPRLIDR
jgi:hypothetical protein